MQASTYASMDSRDRSWWESDRWVPEGAVWCKILCYLWVLKKGQYFLGFKRHWLFASNLASNKWVWLPVPVVPKVYSVVKYWQLVIEISVSFVTTVKLSQWKFPASFRFCVMLDAKAIWPSVLSYAVHGLLDWLIDQLNLWYYNTNTEMNKYTNG